MAQLWGGRFAKPCDEEVYNFNQSLGFDKRLYKCDITGSIAHATMLGKQGIISSEESDKIVTELKKILEELENGTLVFDDTQEDIHSFVEATLINRIGDAGKKLHTGRSRNDQVALDMRLYTRDYIDKLILEVHNLLKAIYDIMKDNLHTYMPAFTHLQKAQPTTLAHYMGAYFEMFSRDKDRLKSIRERMNYCPLGSGALCGTTYNLDREFVANALGFNGPTLNSMDSVSDRDYLIELLNALSLIMMHLSRLSEEMIIFNTNEYRFIEMDDSFSTGSSIMPQKKNPDIAELVRGKSGRVYGSLMSMLTTMKALPLAYNKDMQEDKEISFDAMDTVLSSVHIYSLMLPTITFNKERMAASAMMGFTNATDAADYLVNKGVPFRDAHGIIGKLVLLCEEKKCSIEDLSLDELKNISECFETDVYDAISLKECVNKRLTIGAPGIEAMEEVLKTYALKEDL